MKPTVSIIIPAYNAERFILRCIDSCLRQTMRTIEILVIDDGSTDRTQQVVKAIQDPRVRLISSERNLGPGHARNLGLQMAIGDWIEVLDADDTIEPERTQVLYENAIRLGDRAVLFDQIVVITEDASGNLRPFHVTDSRRSAVEVLAIPLSTIIHEDVGCQPFFPRLLAVENNVRYPLDTRFGEDLAFLVQLGSLPSVSLHQVKRPLYKYHHRAFSLTGNPGKYQELRVALEGLLHGSDLPSDVASAVSLRLASISEQVLFQEFKQHALGGHIRKVVTLALHHPSLILCTVMNIPGFIKFRWHLWSGKGCV